MSKLSIQAIFAAAGIMFTGAVTTDAVAMAVALQDGRDAALIAFVKQHPESRFAPDALMKVALKGNKGSGVGNYSTGNQGDGGKNNKGRAGGSA